MNFFRYDIVVAEFPVFVYVVSLAGRQVPPCTRNNVHKYKKCCHNNIITKKVHILTRDFS